MHNNLNGKKKLLADMTFCLKTIYMLTCKAASPYLSNHTNKIVFKGAFHCLWLAMLRFWFAKPPFK